MPQLETSLATLSLQFQNRASELTTAAQNPHRDPAESLIDAKTATVLQNTALALTALQRILLRDLVRAEHPSRLTDPEADAIIKEHLEVGRWTLPTASS